MLGVLKSFGDIKFIDTDFWSPDAQSVIGETDVHTDNCQASLMHWNNDKSPECRVESIYIFLGRSGKASK